MRQVWRATVKRRYSMGTHEVFTAELSGPDGQRDVTFTIDDIDPIDRPKVVVGATFDWTVERDDSSRTITRATFP